MRVELRQPIDEGVAGVIASVAGLIAGAASDGGFNGLDGRLERWGPLRSGAAMAGPFLPAPARRNRVADIDQQLADTAGSSWPDQIGTGRNSDGDELPTLACVTVTRVRSAISGPNAPKLGVRVRSRVLSRTDAHA